MFIWHPCVSELKEVVTNVSVLIFQQNTVNFCTKDNTVPEGQYVMKSKNINDKRHCITEATGIINGPHPPHIPYVHTLYIVLQAAVIGK